MITSYLPSSWEDLENVVTDILKKAKLHVERRKVVSTVRGKVEIDVYATQNIHGRDLVIFCECKHWKSKVSQSVVHSFRSVMNDAGANIGYIISSSGFQKGAVQACSHSNIKLLTWDEFQIEFEPDYYEKYFLIKLAEYVDSLCSFTDPISPHTFLASGRLKEEKVKEFVRLIPKYEGFAFLCLSYWLRSGPIQNIKTLTLPIKRYYPVVAKAIPEELASIEDYENFLERARAFAFEGISSFRKLLS